MHSDSNSFWEIAIMRFRPVLGASALALTVCVWPAFGQAPRGSSTSERPAATEPLAPVFDDSGVTRAVSSARIDGKVVGLNSESFAALAALKRANPNGTLTEAQAMQLRGALLRDQTLDDQELDLLQELTQSQFRGINVTPTGAEITKVVTHPTSGMAKKVLQETLMPRLNLNAAWAQGNAGWNEITKASKFNALEETRVVNFVAGKLEAEWDKSNQGNGYKPLRDLISQLYGYTGTPGSDANGGRAVLYKANKQVDAKVNDKVPDFLYNWIRPGGYM
jgi:hypothetical protein